MDAKHFDTLTKSLMTSRLTRWHALQGMVLGTAGALARLVSAADETVARKRRRRKHRRKRKPAPPHPGECKLPGAACSENAECCAQACLDNGVCSCFSLTVGELDCPSGCRCDQVSPGAVGACVEDINVSSCCASLPLCNSNTDCGSSAFCDQSVCGGGICVRRCAA